jgi:predicted nucleotidyltransferase
MTTQTKELITMLIQRHATAIKAYGVLRLGIFGSFSRGQQKKDSDVDILVDFRPDLKTYDNFINLAFFLEEIFKRRVDLVTPDSLSPYIGPQVLDEVEYVALNG